MSPIGISVLLLAALVAFTYFSWRKLAIVASLAPEVRWDHPGARVLSVIRNGLLQRRLVRDAFTAEAPAEQLVESARVVAQSHAEALSRAAATVGRWAQCEVPAGKLPARDGKKQEDKRLGEGKA